MIFVISLPHMRDSSGTLIYNVQLFILYPSASWRILLEHLVVRLKADGSLVDKMQAEWICPGGTFGD